MQFETNDEPFFNNFSWQATSNEEIYMPDFCDGPRAVGAMRLSHNKNPVKSRIPEPRFQFETPEEFDFQPEQFEFKPSFEPELCLKEAFDTSLDFFNEITSTQGDPSRSTPGPTSTQMPKSLNPVCNFKLQDRSDHSYKNPSKPD